MKKETSVRTEKQLIVEKEIKDILINFFDHSGSVEYHYEKGEFCSRVKFKISLFDAIIKYNDILHSDDIECIPWKRMYNVSLKCSESETETKNRIQKATFNLNYDYNKKSEIEFYVLVEDNPIFGIKPEKIEEEEAEYPESFITEIYMD